MFVLQLFADLHGSLVIVSAFFDQLASLVDKVDF